MHKYLGLAVIFLVGLLFDANDAIAAERHARGSLVVHNRTVYFVGNDYRYPFPSMKVLNSWGHKASEIVPANSEDLKLPVGPVAKLNNVPVGHVDEVTQDGFIRGWVMDRDHLNDTDINVAVYFDSSYESYPVNNPDSYSTGSGAYSRPDVNTVMKVSGDFGFEIPVPDKYKDGVWHTAYVYGIDEDDTTGKVRPLISGSPISFLLYSQFYANIISFSSSDEKILPGESATLTWATENATTVKLNGETVPASGSKVVTPTITTDYILAVNDRAGNYSKVITIKVLTGAALRDEQRLEDIITIVLGIALYADANGEKFPDSLQSLVPQYLKYIPTGPAGSSYPCVGSDNEYVYTPSADRTNFTFKYCFETDQSEGTGDETLKPGVHVIDYNDTLTQSQATARDARRLADIRQIQTSLELFYNDNNRYPTSMNSMPNMSDGASGFTFNTYLSIWPTAPTPLDGSCTANQNTYAYSQLNNGTKYSLTFCLGASTGGYAAGLHTASPSGIQ